MMEGARPIKYWKMEAECCLGWQLFKRSECEKLPVEIKFVKLSGVSFVRVSSILAQNSVKIQISYSKFNGNLVIMLLVGRLI